MEDLKRWECFCDEAYYHKWAVRDKADKSFYSAVHVETKEEAEFLANSLNELLTLQDRYNAQEKELKLAIIALEYYADKSMWPATGEFYGNDWNVAEQALTQLKAKEA